MTAIDIFIQYLFAIPIHGKSAPVVADAFMDNVVLQGGALLTVHSDNGREFNNKIFNKIAKLLHIRHMYSLPCHPMDNAKIEASHKRIKTILRASLGRQQTELWPVAVRAAVRTLNSLEQPHSGLTPNFLYYGRESALPVASLVRPPRPENDPLTPRERVIQLSQQSALYLTQHRLGLEVIQCRRAHQGILAHPFYPLPSHVGQSCIACDTSELWGFTS